MLKWSSLCRSARWPTALAKCQAHAQQQPSNSLAWVHGASQLFSDLITTRQETAIDSCEIMPVDALHSLGQHWVDVTLGTIVSRRVAEVYPPARADYTSCSSSLKDSEESDEGLEASAEAVLSLWAAHTLLSALLSTQTTQLSTPDSGTITSPSLSSRTVDECFAQSLQCDVVPVVSYLVRFSDAFSHRTDSVTLLHVLHRSLVLVLSSLLATWQTPPLSSPNAQIASSASGKQQGNLCEGESALAQAICMCIETLLRAAQAAEMNIAPASNIGGKPTTNNGVCEYINISSLRLETSMQFEWLSSQLKPLLVEKELLRKGSLLRACTKCIKDSTSSNESEGHVARGKTCGRNALLPFVGVTGVPVAAEEPDEAVDRINQALNQVALTSSGQL